MDKVPESNILVKFCDGAQVFVRNLFEEILSSYLSIILLTRLNNVRCLHWYDVFQDYFECLHNRKEFLRVNALIAEATKQQQAASEGKV